MWVTSFNAPSLYRQSALSLRSTAIQRMPADVRGERASPMTFQLPAAIRCSAMRWPMSPDAPAISAVFTVTANVVVSSRRAQLLAQRSDQRILLYLPALGGDAL